uniref:Uncharacterized protein n=1 Tax=Rhizophora mucronata TaxID=61149 RepID=A0A2P2N4U9_RHIMU
MKIRMVFQMMHTKHFYFNMLLHFQFG